MVVGVHTRKSYDFFQAFLAPPPLLLSFASTTTLLSTAAAYYSYYVLHTTNMRKKRRRRRREIVLACMCCRCTTHAHTDIYIIIQCCCNTLAMKFSCTHTRMHHIIIQAVVVWCGVVGVCWNASSTSLLLQLQATFPQNHFHLWQRPSDAVFDSVYDGYGFRAPGASYPEPSVHANGDFKFQRFTDSVQNVAVFSHQAMRHSNWQVNQKAILQVAEIIFIANPTLGVHVRLATHFNVAFPATRRYNSENQVPCRQIRLLPLRGSRKRFGIQNGLASAIYVDKILICLSLINDSNDQVSWKGYILLLKTEKRASAGTQRTPVQHRAPIQQLRGLVRRRTTAASVPLVVPAATTTGLVADAHVCPSPHVNVVPSCGRRQSISGEEEKQ